MSSSLKTCRGRLTVGWVQEALQEDREWPTASGTATVDGSGGGFILLAEHQTMMRTRSELAGQRKGGY